MQQKRGLVAMGQNHLDHFTRGTPETREPHQGVVFPVCSTPCCDVLFYPHLPHYFWWHKKSLLSLDMETSLTQAWVNKVQSCFSILVLNNSVLQSRRTQEISEIMQAKASFHAAAVCGILQHPGVMCGCVCPCAFFVLACIYTHTLSLCMNWLCYPNTS